MAARLRFLAFLLFAAVLFSACGQAATASARSETASVPSESVTDAAVYLIPSMALSGFDASAAETDGGVRADLSSLPDGYIAMSVSSDTRLKFQVLRGDEKYNYDLPNDGTPTVYPLNLGSGDYTFRVMKNVTGCKYTELWSRTETVALQSEFAPFLRPSQLIPYDANSACVAKARELAAACQDDVAVVSAVYDWMVEAVSYDRNKAERVQSGYLPNPDATLESGTGICFDYAALAAAMLRSLGIPCKLITGYVDPDEVYHAWNEIYLDHQGWITVEIKAGADTWKRVDITFAASGVSPSETDDDALYTTRYIY
ncbi:MAG: transglutaminase-like domain-containing protein [Oscillospiraceae bacterium]|nr:transglutaminase-like domain-containing protein [Oscillospiraceae bacterium]